MNIWYCEVFSIDGDYANLKRTDKSLLREIFSRLK